MIEITETAGTQLKTALDKKKADPGVCIRVEVTLSQGGVLKFDKERPGDKSVEFNNRKVLVLDEKAAAMYADRRLDFAEGKFCFDKTDEARRS